MTSRIPLTRAVTISALCAALLTGCGGPESPAASSDTAALPTRCVDNLSCVQGKHWDPRACTCVADAPACVDTVLCVQGTHWDSKACTCVADTPACLDTVLCVQGTHWDSKACTCVADSPTCVDTVLCVQGTHWDSKACRCVRNEPGGCTTDADCTGALPALCLTCSDGVTGCAHWACVGGRCETRYCN